MGLLWLSTIPPTSALVAIMFGPRWLTMLLGIAFFSHQVGGFLGVWLGGVLFERTGSYDVDLVGLDRPRRRLGGDQPADRRTAGAKACGGCGGVVHRRRHASPRKRMIQSAIATRS